MSRKNEPRNVPTAITIGNTRMVAPVISGEIIYKEMVLPIVWAIDRKPMETTYVKYCSNIENNDFTI